MFYVGGKVLLYAYLAESTASIQEEETAFPKDRYSLLGEGSAICLPRGESREHPRGPAVYRAHILEWTCDHDLEIWDHCHPSYLVPCR